MYIIQSPIFKSTLLYFLGFFFFFLYPHDSFSFTFSKVLKTFCKLCVVTHAFNLSPQEAEQRRSRSLLGLHNKTLPKINFCYSLSYIHLIWFIHCPTIKQYFSSLVSLCFLDLCISSTTMPAPHLPTSHPPPPKSQRMSRKKRRKEHTCWRMGRNAVNYCLLDRTRLLPSGTLSSYHYLRIRSNQPKFLHHWERCSPGHTPKEGLLALAS